MGKLKVMADLYSPNDPHQGSADYGYRTDRPVQADIPAQPDNRGRRNGGLAAGLVAFLAFVFGKLSYIGLLALKLKGLWFTVISTGVTALIYTQLFGAAFGVGIVLLILIHESGHVVVGRVLGMPVSLPVMIPFLGAFVNVKEQPRSVAQESIMAIGGPVLGSVAAGLCYVGYLTMPTSSMGQLLRALAYFGFLINLFNLIPLTPLDGGRVTSLLSKWFNVAGLLIAAGLLLFELQSGTGVNPVLFLVLIFGAFSTWQRFRSTALNPAYYAVDTQTKVIVGALYLGLLFTLGVGMLQTAAVLRPAG
ncbi:MAG: site-2 protease family protein [Candidatus Dormibacteraeota bacterium]|nr:site-2 protease family protein [Candidatus Dormibacteraeota bacterium]